MNVRGPGLPIGTSDPETSTRQQDHHMQTQVKNALISTAVVLATIFALNQFGPTRNLVQKALT